MTRLVLFDIDGTLLIARGAPRRAFERAMVEVYGTAGPVATHRFDGKTDPQIARELLVLAGVADAAIDAGLPDLWQRYTRQLRIELDAPGHRTVVLPGVHELLHALDALDGRVVLGLLTGNIEAGAAMKLDPARIRTRFRVGAFGSDCERRDGLPQVAVDRARALTGRTFRAREIVVIGDTPHDVTCGRALDVHTVAVATGRHDVAVLRDAGAHAVFGDLSDTAAVMEAVLGAAQPGG
jgi:phosphoglycolate phosphatase-like HAD superfamily hydrolase